MRYTSHYLITVDLYLYFLRIDESSYQYILRKLIISTILHYRFKVYEFNLENEQQYDVVASRASNEFYDFWSAPNMFGLPTTVMVHPKEQLSFISTLDEAKIPYSVLIENVETYVSIYFTIIMN